jgi:hypothetical protein
VHNALPSILGSVFPNDPTVPFISRVAAAGQAGACRLGFLSLNNNPSRLTWANLDGIYTDPSAGLDVISNSEQQRRGLQANRPHILWKKARLL